jgi:hypothetical protein
MDSLPSDQDPDPHNPPHYIFDGAPAQRHSLRDDITTPGVTLFDFGSWSRVDPQADVIEPAFIDTTLLNLQFYIGPPGSGAPMHFHA